MKKNFPIIFLASLLFIFPIVSPTITRAQLSKTADASAKPTTLLKDELYFGLTKPGGEMISESEWQEFVNVVITPHFREGLTVLNADGQFLNSSGILIREKSKIVILIYENIPEKERYIQKIIKTYKDNFQQESVLRVTSQVQVSF
ncbi:DUF3574 domain-containing protein [Microcoleus sp. EPA2]|uniref:DUF3574 domain-containing protein n=1 Tax=Microcoleus sp. EPA2 TaxID=2841654 RepID=UPI00312B89D5